MRFIQDSSFTVKPDKVEELQGWVVENQSRLAATYPEGTSLVGIFVTVFGNTTTEGDCHILEQLDSYAALDRMAAEGKKRDSDFMRLSMEMMQFLDFSRGAATTTRLLKDLLDATVMNAPAEEAKELETV